MQIDNEFTVSVPIEQAWAVLTDLAAIAPCMPGAQLTGLEGDVYSGKVKVKVGPVTSEYAGTAQFAQKDDTGYHAVIDAKGRDARGAGNASALITAQLRPDGASTVVTVSTDLKISGRIAQFGSGMIKEVSAKLLGQFVESLEGKLAASSAETAAGVTAAGSTTGQAQAGLAEGAPAGAGPAVPARSTPAPGAVAGTEPDEVTIAAAGTQAAAMTGGPVSGAAVTAGIGGQPGLATEPPPLDLMSVAGSSIYKRAVPLVVALIVIIGLIIYFTAG